MPIFDKIKQRTPYDGVDGLFSTTSVIQSDCLSTFSDSGACPVRNTYTRLLQQEAISYPVFIETRKNPTGLPNHVKLRAILVLRVISAARSFFFSRARVAYLVTSICIQNTSFSACSCHLRLSMGPVVDGRPALALITQSWQLFFVCGEETDTIRNAFSQRSGTALLSRELRLSLHWELFRWYT